MPRVKMPTGEIVDMPDNPTPEQLSALSQIHAAPAAAPEPVEAPEPQQPGLFSAQRLGLEGIGKAPGMIARGIGTGLAGTVGMVGDAMNAGINMGGRAMGMNPNLGRTSDAIQRGMTAVGVPEAKTPKEQALSTLVSLAAGGRDPVMQGLTKRFLPPTAPRNLTVREEAIRGGQAMGYQTPPSQATGGAAGTTFEALSDKHSLWNSMALKNQTLTDQLARRISGLADDTPISEEALGAVMDRTLQTGYAPLRAIGNITTGGVYNRALDRVLMDFQGTPRTVPTTVRNDVQDLVQSYRLRNFDSSHAIDAIRNLRRDATQSFRNNNANLGDAQRAISRALENNLELNLAGRGQNGAAMLQTFRDARVRYAQQNVILQALEKETGQVNLQKIVGQAKQKREGYLTGDLDTMAKFGANAHRVTKIPTEQSVPIVRHPVQSTLGTMAAAALGGPIPAVAVGAMPFGQAGLRHAMMSRAGQRMIAPNTDPGLLAKLMGNPEFVNAMPNLLQQSGLFGQ